jgi:SPRY domain
MYNTIVLFGIRHDWHPVFGKDGFTTGIHYWTFQIISSASNHIMIGVSKDLNVTKSTYHGLTTTGVFLSGHDGIVQWDGNREQSDSWRYTKGDVVGTLLNMNQKTITFYLNGSYCVVRDVTEEIYYPCISFIKLGQRILSI